MFEWLLFVLLVPAALVLGVLAIPLTLLAAGLVVALPIAAAVGLADRLESWRTERQLRRSLEARAARLAAGYQPTPRGRKLPPPRGGSALGPDPFAAGGVIGRKPAAKNPKPPPFGPKGDA